MRRCWRPRTWRLTMTPRSPQWRLEVERLRYEAERAERRYGAVEPENRLVARGLEAEWERCLQALAGAEAELVARTHRRPRALSPQERATRRFSGYTAPYRRSA